MVNQPLRASAQYAEPVCTKSAHLNLLKVLARNGVRQLAGARVRLRSVSGDRRGNNFLQEQKK